MRVFRVLPAGTILAAGLLCLLAELPATAQGVGRRGPPPGVGPQSKPTSGGAGAAGGLDSSFRPRTFGAWLDNGDVLGPGDLWLSLYTVYWRSDSFREIDAPVVDLAIGLAPRVQFGVNVPYYNLSDARGATSRGVGDVYLNAKIALIDSGDRGFALAVSPGLEILSAAAGDLGFGRVNWVLPVSAHVDHGRARLYGTAGYFSRGSLFGSGAVEARVHPKVSLLGALTHAYSTETNLASDAAGASRRRTDAIGGFYYLASPSLTLFATVGRTLSRIDESAAAAAVTAGFTVSVADGSVRVPRRP